MKVLLGIVKSCSLCVCVCVCVCARFIIDWTPTLTYAAAGLSHEDVGAAASQLPWAQGTIHHNPHHFTQFDHPNSFVFNPAAMSDPQASGMPTTDRWHLRDPSADQQEAAEIPGIALEGSALPARRRRAFSSHPSFDMAPQASGGQDWKISQSQPMTGSSQGVSPPGSWHEQQQQQNLAGQHSVPGDGWVSVSPSEEPSTEVSHSHPPGRKVAFAYSHVIHTLDVLVSLYVRSFLCIHPFPVWSRYI